MKNTSTLILVALLGVGCAPTKVDPHAIPPVDPGVLMGDGPAPNLFKRKAHKSEWVKASCSHWFHDYGEGIFYFECGFRAFVLFDKDGYPTDLKNY